MKNIKNFKNFIINELNDYSSYDTPTNDNQYDSSITTDKSSVFQSIIDKGVKPLEVLINFGSITNEEQLQAKASEMLNIMYKMSDNPEEKEVLSTQRNELISELMNKLSSSGMNFNNNSAEEEENYYKY